MPTSYIALGTNLGDRLGNLREALSRFAPQVQIMQLSSVYETEPWGLEAQPQFLNMVARAETKLQPGALLTFLKSIERAMGREASVRYGPRLIDLDILFYDDQVINSDKLAIPHPRIAERRFVLVPLVELAPDLIHPLLRVPVCDLLARLPDDKSVRYYSHLSQ